MVVVVVVVLIVVVVMVMVFMVLMFCHRLITMEKREGRREREKESERVGYLSKRRGVHFHQLITMKREREGGRDISS